MTRGKTWTCGASYLHANCAHCHVTAGGGNALIDLDFFAPLKRRKLINHTRNIQFGIHGAKMHRRRATPETVGLFRAWLARHDDLPVNAELS